MKKPVKLDLLSLSPTEREAYVSATPQVASLASLVHARLLEHISHCRGCQKTAKKLGVRYHVLALARTYRVLCQTFEEGLFKFHNSTLASHRGRKKP